MACTRCCGCSMRGLQRGQDVVEILNVACTFHAAVRLGEAVSATFEVGTSNEVKLKAMSGETVLLTASVRYQALGETVKELASNRASNPISDPVAIVDALPESERPAPLTATDVASANGAVPLVLSRALARAMFPHASIRLHTTQFAAILGSTRVVGMRVPGIHSMFYSLALQKSDHRPDNQFRYEVERFDHRFSRAAILLNGGQLSGKAIAFLRPAPVTQLSFFDAKKCVNPGEFASQRALVIGGSRGLGEIAVKQLAAAGAAVQFSYHSGEADARRLTDEICGGGGKADCFQLAVGAATPSQSPSLEALCKSFAPHAPLLFCNASSRRFGPRKFFHVPLSRPHRVLHRRIRGGRAVGGGRRSTSLRAESIHSLCGRNADRSGRVCGGKGGGRSGRRSHG